MGIYPEIVNYYDGNPNRRMCESLDQINQTNRVQNEFAQFNESIFRSNCVEFWKPITEKEVPDIHENRYYLSTFGNTWDAFTGKPMPLISSAGNKYYQQVNLKLKSGKQIVRKLHRLIMMIFCPVEDPTALQVNHIDGNHSNNNLYNLEWCNDSYNRIHSIINGVGTNNFYHQIIQLTPEIVHKLKVYREDMNKQTHEIYFELMPELQQLGTYEAFRHLIPSIANGKSKLYSRFYV